MEGSFFTFQSYFDYVNMLVTTVLGSHGYYWNEKDTCEWKKPHIIFLTTEFRKVNLSLE